MAKEYKCKYCGKILGKKKELIFHQTHCKLRIYQCEFCNKDFSSAMGLSIHKIQCIHNPNRNINYKNPKKDYLKELNNSEQNTICQYCGREFKRFRDKKYHESFCNLNPNATKNIVWNKGKTKETDFRVKQYGETLSTRFLNGELISFQKGLSITEDVKNKISESMKKAHAEGRAHNIGQSRWNNEQSYPEKFFTKVIENEFKDKNYKTEYPLGIYALDFAWVDKKKAIEIDGEQHQRFQEYIDRDKRKDAYAVQEGWQILRIKWSDMYNDTKKWIKIAKEFIEYDNR